MQTGLMIPIQSTDGRQVNLEIIPKNLLIRKRRVKTWTSEEDQQLINLHNRHPKKWALIASLMVDRNENQCLHRYRRLQQLGTNRKIWSHEEDETIKKLIKKIGKNWKQLSEMLGSKTGKQIRERFINKLDPKIRKEDWTDEEDRKIIEMYSRIGSKWSEMSKQLPGRPENKVKNRFYSYIQKNYEIKRSFTDEAIQMPAPKEITLASSTEFKQEITPAGPSPFSVLYGNNQQSVVRREFGTEIKNTVSVKYAQHSGYPSLQDIEMDDGCNMENINHPNCSKISLRSYVKMDDDVKDPRFNSISDFNEHNDGVHSEMFHFFQN